jgi:hypothetical protein
MISFGGASDLDKDEHPPLPNMSEAISGTTAATPAGAAETAKAKPRLREKGRLMSASEIERTLVRLAHEIVE